MMEKPTPKIILVFLVSSLAVLVCYLTLIIFLLGPALADKVLAPLAASECSKIRAGMTRKQVFSLIHKKVLPGLEQSASPNRLEFFRADSSCVVDFDSQTQTVTASTVFKPGEQK